MFIHWKIYIYSRDIYTNDDGVGIGVHWHFHFARQSARLAIMGGFMLCCTCNLCTGHAIGENGRPVRSIPTETGFVWSIWCMYSIPVRWEEEEEDHVADKTWRDP